MDKLSVKDALPVFYDNYQLEPDGGIHDTAVKVELLKGIFVYLPNFNARKKVLFKHDVHHLLTGYSAKMKGETEISAWELSTGCAHNWFAFAINTYSMVNGAFFNMKGIWKAWVRGRYSSNLYKKYDDEQLLLKNVADLKKEMGLSEENSRKSPGFSSFLSFTGFLVFGIVFALVSIVIIPFVIVYSLFMMVQRA